MRRLSGSALHSACRLLLPLLLAVGTAWAQTQPGQIYISDDIGHHLKFAAPPMRIVTLLPSLTETVCVLQACGRIVGTDRYSNWPQEVRRLPKLGGLDDTSLEAIVALKPDVVLAARSARVLDRLEELGVPVLVLESTTLEGSHHVMVTVAQLLGDAARGEQAWQAVESRIAAAAQRVPAGFRGKRVYFEVGQAPFAASESSFIGELLSRLGLANAIPASLGPFPRLNPEFVVRADPDLIMASATELASMRSRPGWDGMTALRKGRTCGFPSASIDVLLRPGPRLGEAAEALVRCLTELAQQERS